MSLRLQIILLVFLGIGLAVVVNMVRRRVLELKYVLVWLFADAVLVVLVLFPKLIKAITRALGIQSTMNIISGYYFFIDSGDLQGDGRSAQNEPDDCDAGQKAAGEQFRRYRGKRTY